MRHVTTRDLALASMVRDDPPASSTASSTAAVVLVANGTSVTDRQTDTDIVA